MGSLAEDFPEGKVIDLDKLIFDSDKTGELKKFAIENDYLDFHLKLDVFLNELSLNDLRKNQNLKDYTKREKLAEKKLDYSTKLLAITNRLYNKALIKNDAKNIIYSFSNKTLALLEVRNKLFTEIPINKKNNTEKKLQIEINKETYSNLTKEFDDKLEQTKRELKDSLEDYELRDNESNLKPKDQLRVLHQLGVFDYLREKHYKENTNMLAEALSFFLNLKQSTIYSYINPIDKDIDPKNSILNDEKACKKIKETLILKKLIQPK